MRRSAEEIVLDRDGLTLEEHGFKPFLARLTEDVFSPLMQALYGVRATHINSFIVKYAMDGDREHFLHSDGSAFTLNVCLGTNFEGTQRNLITFLLCFGLVFHICLFLLFPLFFVQFSFGRR
jgi:hypothetical protein